MGRERAQKVAVLVLELVAEEQPGWANNHARVLCNTHSIRVRSSADSGPAPVVCPSSNLLTLPTVTT